MGDSTTDDEPEGAAALRILARAMIQDYAAFGAGRVVSWLRGREVKRAAREAVEAAGLGTEPRALEYLVQELTVQLADMTLRTTELAKVMAEELREDGRLQ